MPRRDQPGFDHSLTIAAPASKVVAAFFTPASLSGWWDVVASVTTPRLLGAYAIEWTPSEDRDELLGQLGGVFHGTVMEHNPERGFFVADAYWLPPEGEPIGPMAFTVSCKRRRQALPATDLHVTQTGLDTESERWIRYYEILRAGFPGALERLKHYLEHGKGAWDLGAW